MPAWRPAWRPPNSRPPRQSATSSGHPFFKLRALLCDRQVPQRQPTRTRRAQSRTPAWRMLKSRRSRRAAAAAASCAPRTCRRRRRCPRGRCPRRMPRSGCGCPPCVLPEGRRQFCALLCSMQDHRRVWEKRQRGLVTHGACPGRVCYTHSAQRGIGLSPCALREGRGAGAARASGVAGRQDAAVIKSQPASTRCCQSTLQIAA